MAFKLKKLFDKQMKREFPAVVEDDDDDFFGESRGRGKKQAKSVKSDTSVQSKQGLSKPLKIAPQKVTQVAGTSNTVNNTASPASRRKSIKKTTTNAVDMPKLAPAGMHSALVNGINVNGQTISPEFARAQILATQAKIKSQNQSQANISNVLPTRFGIPPEALMGLSPAQAQLLSMAMSNPRTANVASLMQNARANMRPKVPINKGRLLVLILLSLFQI